MVTYAKIPNNKSRVNPSDRSSTASKPLRTGSKVIASRIVVPRRSKGSSRFMTWPSIAIGATRAAIPSTSPRLARLEPAMLPNAISVSPFKAPQILITSSGALVPNATTVRPTTYGDTPRDSATPDAPRTRNAPPRRRSIRPTSKRRSVFIC